MQALVQLFRSNPTKRRIGGDLDKMIRLDLASGCETSLLHVVPSEHMFGGGFTGGFVKGCGAKVQENQPLEAVVELQVQNIE